MIASTSLRLHRSAFFALLVSAGILAVLATGALPHSAHAQAAATQQDNTGSGATTQQNNTGTGSSGCGSSTGGLTNPLNNICSLPALLTAILGGIVQIGSIFLTVMLVYVGFLFVAARGNSEKIQGAREALVWTVIGGLILLGATAIGLVIQGTVGTL